MIRTGRSPNPRGTSCRKFEAGTMCIAEVGPGAWRLQELGMQGVFAHDRELRPGARRARRDRACGCLGRRRRDAAAWWRSPWKAHPHDAAAVPTVTAFARAGHHQAMPLHDARIPASLRASFHCYRCARTWTRSLPIAPASGTLRAPDERRRSRRRRERLKWTSFPRPILTHYWNPRCHGTVSAPDARVEDANPLCGDRLRMDFASRTAVAEVRFTGTGCSDQPGPASPCARRQGRRSTR
jgi:hypothetical protein